jgi:LysM repeat protein
MNFCGTLCKSKYKIREKAMKHLLIMLFVLIFASGCNLGVQSTTTNPVAPTTTLPSNVTNTPDASSELSPIDTVVVTPANTTVRSTNTPALLENCTPRTEWETYVVQRGDSLSRIATISGSTLDEIIAANCLENPDRIRAGQEIFVPSLPTTPTSSPTQTP